MVVGTILWASVLKSGVHATLAGVIIGFCIPLKGKNGETPLHDFEHILAPWSSFVILPLFAFANAGVSFDGIDLSMLTSPLLLAISSWLNYRKNHLRRIWFQLSFPLNFRQLQNYHKASTSNKFLPWRFYAVSASPCRCS